MRSLLGGPVTIALIALNVAVSIAGFWALGREKYAASFLFIPYRAARGQNSLGTLLSHFAHGDIGHLLLNMVALFMFGRQVERVLGAVEYLALYVISGIAATLTVFLFRRKNPRYSALGASGSIAGVVFALMVIAPSSSMFLLFVPIPVPAPIFAVLYLAMSSLLMQRGDHIAHEAHLGGALAGLALAGLFFDRGFAPLVRAVTRLLA
jgi:membrane associated rhomboid family serine protease